MLRDCFTKCERKQSAFCSTRYLNFPFNVQHFYDGSITWNLINRFALGKTLLCSSKSLMTLTSWPLPVNKSKLAVHGPRFTDSMRRLTQMKYIYKRSIKINCERQEVGSKYYWTKWFQHKHHEILQSTNPTILISAFKILFFMLTHQLLNYIF